MQLLDPQVVAYLAGLAPAEDPLLARMEAYAEQRGFPLVGRQAGRWLELLTRMIGGRRVLELGSGWGYSAFWFARGAGPAGQVIGTELDEHELRAHARLFQGHPLARRIHIHHGDSLQILAKLPGSFDVIFMDLHKEDYPRTLERVVPRIRPGGLLIADNVLWGGKVTHPAAQGDQSTRAVQRFNRLLHADPRLRAAILPADDGLAVAIRLEG